MSDKTWGRTETGSTFHNFRPDGTAVCRKNLRVGRNLGGRTRELAETHAASMHGRVAGRTMCATCVKKDDEYNARFEASMAPVNAYDQVCEGFVTDEGAAKAAESDEHTDVDTLHGEAIAEDTERTAALDRARTAITGQLGEKLADMLLAGVGLCCTAELVELFPAPAVESSEAAPGETLHRYHARILYTGSSGWECTTPTMHLEFPSSTVNAAYKAAGLAEKRFKDEYRAGCIIREVDVWPSRNND